MKNLFNKWVVVLMIALATVGYSCQDCDHEPYDDTELREQIADLYSKLAALESKVNANMETVSQMLSGRTAIQSYTQDQDGNWVLTLTDGKQITVYAEYEPEALPTSLVYVMEVEIDGVKTKVWATMGADGQLTPIMDGEDYIPVVPEEVEMPTIPSLEYKVEDGKIWIKLSNSDEWIETGMNDEALDSLLNQSGACGITKVEFNTQEDQWGDEVVVSATFTLSDGSTFTVAMDGVSSFEFQYWGDPVDTFYLAPGATETNLTLAQKYLVDFVKEVPQGWNISFGEADDRGDYPITLTAPTAAAIESGSAVAEGTIKLIGVFEGGKTAIAKLNVTTTAFKTVQVVDGRVLIEPNNGVEAFVYGILPASEYSAETLKSTLTTTYLPNGLWSDWAAPYNASSWWQIIDTSAATVYGQTLTPGEKYVAWAAPLTQTPDYAYQLNSDFSTYAFAQIIAEATFSDITHTAIKVTLNFQGFDNYFGGVVENEYFSAENELSYINGAYKNGFDSTLTKYPNTNSTYSGSLSSLPCANGLELKFDTEYTFWMIPVEEGKTVYTESDIRVFTAKTNNVQSGGSATVSVKSGTTPEITMTSASIWLQATAGSAGYYKWYKRSELPAESELTMDILTTGPMVSTEMAATNNDLEADTEYTLAAVAVDAQGCYGEVFKYEFKTEGITFSETFKLTVTKQVAANPFDDATKATFQWTVEGGTATKYYYINLTDDQMVNKYGSDEAVAAELVLNTNYGRKTAYVSNGVYTITGLTTGTQYTLYTLVYDGTNYSKMQKVTYTPTAPSFNVIPATDTRWEASKPTVKVDSATASSGYCSVTYTVTPATGTKVEGGHFASSSMTGDAKAQITTIMTGTVYAHYITALEAAQSYTKSFNISTSKIYLTWTDAEGNYYEPMAVTVPAE